MTSPRICRHWFLVSASPSSSTSHSASLAPRRAISSATARPIPCAAPVTTIASPVRKLVMSLLTKSCSPYQLTPPCCHQRRQLVADVSPKDRVAAEWLTAGQVHRCDERHSRGFRHTRDPKGTILLAASCPMSARPNQGIPDL